MHGQNYLDYRFCLTVWNSDENVQCKEKEQVSSACMRLTVTIMISSGFVLARSAFLVTFVCRLT